MPAFWSRPADWTMRSGEWKEDPAVKNWQRYHDGVDFTPHVRIGKCTWWDLARSGRIPLEGECDDDLQGYILTDSRAQLEVTKFTISISWLRNQPGVDASATIDLDALARFEFYPAGNSEKLWLRVLGYNAPEYSAEDIHPGESGVISMSMIFGRQHESTLRDLREVLERMCERRLTGPVERPLAESPGDRAGPRADPVEELTSPAKPGERDVRLAEEAAGHYREDPNVDRRVRPTLPILAVSVETAPDTDEWLSLATTSIDVLLGGDGSDRKGDGGGRDGPTGPSPVADRGSGHD